MNSSKNQSFFGASKKRFERPKSQRTGQRYFEEEEIKNKVDIKPHEKRAVISTFLHSDIVFSKLCRLMFDPRVDGASKEMRTQDSMGKTVTMDNMVMFRDFMNDE